MTGSDIEDLIARLKVDLAEAAIRLIAGAFRRDGERLDSDKRPRFSIPCRPELDDDMVIMRGLRDAAGALSSLRAENEELAKALERCANYIESPLRMSRNEDEANRRDSIVRAARSVLAAREGKR